jgi:hypothetical protein
MKGALLLSSALSLRAGSSLFQRLPARYLYADSAIAALGNKHTTNSARTLSTAPHVMGVSGAARNCR